MNEKDSALVLAAKNGQTSTYGRDCAPHAAQALALRIGRGSGVFWGECQGGLTEYVCVFVDYVI